MSAARSIASLHSATKLSADRSLEVRAPKRYDVRRGSVVDDAGARDLLCLAFGVSTRTPYPRRCNASSGNLHSTEVRALLPGIVARFCAESGDRGELERWSESDVVPPPDTLVIAATMVVERQTSKYGGRGMRYALLDLGHALGSLLLATRARGRFASFVDRPEALVRSTFQLGGPGPAEQPGFVVSVTDAQGPRALGTEWLLPEEFCERGAEWMIQRRSARAFERVAAPHAAYEALLATMRSALAFAGVDLAWTSIVHDVEGVGEGAPDEIDERRIETGFVCGCQVIAENAAFVLVLGARLDVLESSTESVAAYRKAHVAVGAVSQLLLVVAESLGLRGNPLGAFLDDEASALLPSGNVALLAIAFGKPAPT